MAWAEARQGKAWRGRIQSKQRQSKEWAVQGNESKAKAEIREVKQDEGRCMASHGVGRGEVRQSKARTEEGKSSRRPRQGTFRTDARISEGRCKAR
jgi:hypothetical protein